MSKLKYLVIHCTYTPEGREVSRQDIERWHLEERGWSRVGYSDMIHLDGSLENLVPFDQNDEVGVWEITNGAKGYNSISRHIVYVGGHKFNAINEKQIRTLAIYCYYTVLRHPGIKIIGHNQVSNKSCPNFNVSEFCRLLGIQEKNIGL